MYFGPTLRKVEQPYFIIASNFIYQFDLNTLDWDLTLLISSSCERGIMYNQG